MDYHIYSVSIGFYTLSIISYIAWSCACSNADKTKSNGDFIFALYVGFFFFFPSVFVFIVYSYRLFFNS